MLAGGARAEEVSLTMPNPLTTTFTVGSGDYLQSGQASWTLDINSGGVLEVSKPRWETVFQQDVAGTSMVNIATGGTISFTNTTGRGRRFFVGNAAGGAAVGIINLKGGTILGERLAEFSLGRDGAEGYLNISGGAATVGSLVMGTGGTGGGTAKIDFTAGSTGTLSVVGKDVAFFERLFISGQLTHNGISSGNFTNHFHTDGYSVALLGVTLPEPPLLPSPPLIDPRFPAEWHARQAIPCEEWARWPRTRLRQLEAERSRLLAAISVLPQHDPIFLSNHLGYHSMFEEPGSDGSLPPHQIVFKWEFPSRLDSIALVPAFNPKEFGAYAFPKRFKIEVWDVYMAAFETVVNWMDEDFPDPGPYPVLGGGIDRGVSQVRITVPQVARESGVAYYALGEIYLFRQTAAGGVADNMAIWGRSIDVEVSDSFSMPPLWDAQYLNDSIVSLGFPLSDETVEVADLMVTYDDEAQFSDNVQLTLDLGRVQDIGRIDFWPAAAPYLLALPAFGFPEKITVEMSANPDFKPVKVVKANNASRRMHRENLLSIIGEGYDAQYIRVTMEGLSEYKGKRILGLGEISVSELWRSPIGQLQDHGAGDSRGISGSIATAGRWIQLAAADFAAGRMDQGSGQAPTAGSAPSRGGAEAGAGPDRVATHQATLRHLGWSHYCYGASRRIGGAAADAQAGNE
ncbi:MAG: hypothetical protein KAU94_05720 [Verrucomicrobia bacterium]|nr:hypothetical protein [Verrucomicrobiota bacterium]